MDIKITVALAKQFLKKFPDEALEDSLSYRSDHQAQHFTLGERTDEELAFLTTLVEAEPTMPGQTGALRTISTYQNISKDPAGRKVGRLEDLELALNQFLKTATNHWVFVEDDQFILPYAVIGIKYSPYDARTQSPARTTLSTRALSRGHNQERYFTWHTTDIRGKKTVTELMVDKAIFAPTPALMTAYEQTMKNYAVVQPLTGAQFTGEGEAKSAERYSGRTVFLTKDGAALKLVMDDMTTDDNGEEGPAYGKDSTVFQDRIWVKSGAEGEAAALPSHPFVKMFDLDNHRFLIVHTDLLIPYRWSPDMVYKLVLPNDHKDVISILMETAAEEMDDIIKGKSGGTIVISTGEPGTGKTLTAEVTSEVIKKPLYKVNCSQLGTNEVAIEKHLQRVLSRSERWQALLLIDEADVYVRSRGDDIQQNAIVGVFLRVLEYYRGVLFLTSNRATVIDDAIMSRSTVHLKYEKPTPEALLQIWTVLTHQFGMNGLGDLLKTTGGLKKLVETFPGIVGRDVKNLLKLVKRYHAKHGGEVTIDTFKRLAVHKDITPK